MAERTAHEVKDIGLKRLKDSYEKNTNKVADSKKMAEFEKMYVEKILPKVFEGK